MIVQNRAQETLKRLEKEKGQQYVDRILNKADHDDTRDVAIAIGEAAAIGLGLAYIRKYS